jgi:hypothetical protein
VSDLASQLAEDKALRDAALQLFKSDIALIRGGLDERGVAARARDRLDWQRRLGQVARAVERRAARAARAVADGLAELAEPVRALAAGLVGRGHRVLRISQRELRAERGDRPGAPGRLVAELARRRAHEQPADQDAHGDAAGRGGDRVLLGEGDELVLGLDRRLAGAVDARGPAHVAVARLAGGDFVLERLAPGIGHCMSPVESRVVG